MSFGEAGVSGTDGTPRIFLELAVILPTFNERPNIAPMIGRLERALGPSGWEAIFVDDDSDDGTADAVRMIARVDPRIRVIQRIGRRGLASAAIEGICATAAPIIAVMDADHQHDPALLPGMLIALRSNECDIAVASRFIKGASTERWNQPERLMASEVANWLARKVTGIDLTDPMSGYFMVWSDLPRRNANRLSGIGFKILLDILMTIDAPLKVKEFPLEFAPRARGESKLDRAVAFEFLVGLYDGWLGRIVPTRYALFGTVGLIGVAVHMAVLGTFTTLFGGSFENHPVSAFEAGQTVAAFAAMTFNFLLNNVLTYGDQRLRGKLPLVKGWLKFAFTCSVGLLSNVGTAVVLARMGIHASMAALAGILIGSVWNYALSSRFVWGRFGK